VLIELAVPRELALCSSYGMWCDVLDKLRGDDPPGRAVPTGPAGWQRIFREPLLKYRGDAVQAVLPCLRPEWVRACRPVRVVGRRWEEPL
jgi:hypothetical protein